MAQVHQIVHAPITCHAFNADRTQLALCPNNNEIHIFKKAGNDWTLVTVLKEHDQIVTGLDWGAKTNRIVSCSQDRNAYVWSLQGTTWKPTLVILRINRAATSVKWSPAEDKFAVGSGAKCVSVCYFEAENNWWVSKHIKKHKSTVLDVDWHPNNLFLVTASSDFKTRVFSTFIKGIDKRPGETPFGSKLPFGELLGEYASNGWVHTAKWSPSGNQIAYACHDSIVIFIDVTNGAPGDCQIVRLKNLPAVDLVWTDEDTVVAAGHDNQPWLFKRNGGTWSCVKSLDQKEEKKQEAGGRRAAFDMFQNKVKMGTDSVQQSLNTKHQNFVRSVSLYGNQVCTTGIDGKLILWTV